MEKRPVGAVERHGVATWAAALRFGITPILSSDPDAGDEHNADIVILGGTPSRAGICAGGPGRDRYLSDCGLG
jgi:hypothetical protein